MFDMVHRIVADDTSTLCTTSTWKNYIRTVKYGLILSQEICKFAAQNHPPSDNDKVPLRDHAYWFQSYMSVPVEVFRYLIWQGIIDVISHFCCYRPFSARFHMTVHFGHQSVTRKTKIGIVYQVSVSRNVPECPCSCRFEETKDKHDNYNL